MSKNMIKFFVIVVLTVVFMYAFSASYTSDSVDNIAYVIALAVDLNEGEKNLQVTFEFMDTSTFSSEGSSESKSAIIDTINATSIIWLCISCNSCEYDCIGKYFRYDG